MNLQSSLIRLDKPDYIIDCSTLVSSVDVYTQIPENICLTYHFIYTESMNKIIMRLYDKENREFTIHQFESSSDGLTFSDLLSPGSNYGGYLNIVRFQAFYILNVVAAVKY